MQHSGWVRNLAYASLRDYALAEDVSQEVLLKALEGPRRSGRVLRAWLAAVTRNMAKNELRGKMRRRAREEKVARPEGDDSDAEQLAILLSHRAISDAVESLAPQSRQIIVLRYYNEYSFRMIAAHLSMEESAARVRLHRALKELRGHLEQRHGDWRASCLALAPAARIPPAQPSLASPAKILGLISAAGILGIALWWGGHRGEGNPDLTTAGLGVEVAAFDDSNKEETYAQISRADRPASASVDGVQTPIHNPELVPLSGRVFRDWAPVSGANVKFWQAGEIHAIETDSDGRFSFSIDPTLYANVTVQSGGSGRMMSWQPGSPRELAIDLWDPQQEGLEVRVLDDVGRVGIAHATVQLYIDFSGFDRGTSIQGDALQLVAEGVTNENGVYLAPGWLPDLYLVVAAQAEGYLPNRGVPRGVSTRYPEVFLVAGQPLPVQLLYEDGEPVALTDVREGVNVRRMLKTDENGFLPDIAEWHASPKENAIEALPASLSLVLADGRMWSQGAGLLSDEILTVLEDRIQLTVRTDAVKVQIGNLSLPEGSWIEARCVNFRSYSWMPEGIDSMWQRLEPEEINHLARGWVPGGVVRTRLMPGGAPFGKFPVIDGIATVEGVVAHLKLTLEEQPSSHSRPLEAVIPFQQGHAEIRVPFQDGVAEIDLRYQEGDISIGTLEEQFSGKKQPLQGPDGQQVWGFFLESKPVMELHLVAMPRIEREVQIRINGTPILGGQADDISINAQGICLLPFTAEGKPISSSLSLRIPGAIQKQAGGPILSDFYFKEGDEVMGEIVENPNGPWYWDFELALVELMVPPGDTGFTRNVYLLESVVRSHMRWPVQRPEDAWAYATSPPEGGWCALRVPAGTHRFQVGEFFFGGDEGADCVAGEITQLQPDSTEVTGD